MHYVATYARACCQTTVTRQAWRIQDSTAALHSSNLARCLVQGPGNATAFLHERPGKNTITETNTQTHTDL